MFFTFTLRCKTLKCVSVNMFVFKCIFSLYVTFSTELRNYPTLENVHISFYPR